MWVIDFGPMGALGEAFPLYVYDTDLSWGSWVDECDWMLEACSYVASQFSFDGNCSPYFGVENAKLLEGVLTGGGPDHVMTMAFQLGTEVFIPVQIHDAQISGTVALQTGADGQPQVVSADGLFAGATPTKQLFETIAELPDYFFPFDKETAIALLEELIEKDVDLDGDGVKESASIGVRFKAIEAALSGE
jgi:hypothetical protein